MTLQEIVDQLEACNFMCEAGPLGNFVPFQVLKEKASGKNGLSIQVDITKTDGFKNLTNLLYQVVTRVNDEGITKFVLSELEKINEPSKPLMPIQFTDLKIESDGTSKGTHVLVDGEKVTDLLSVRFSASTENKYAVLLGDVFRRKG